jgi:hypothetical protein
MPSRKVIVPYDQFIPVNMAEIELRMGSAFLNFESKMSEKEVNTCLWCEELRL